MDGSRRQRPPKISFGDSDLRTRLPEDARAVRENPLVNREDVDFTGMEQRCKSLITSFEWRMSPAKTPVVTSATEVHLALFSK